MSQKIWQKVQDEKTCSDNVLELIERFMNFLQSEKNIHKTLSIHTKATFFIS